MLNRHVPQPWYWRTNRTRITRAEFYVYGGLSNPRFFRRALANGVWTYWKEER